MNRLLRVETGEKFRFSLSVNSVSAGDAIRQFKKALSSLECGGSFFADRDDCVTLIHGEVQAYQRSLKG